MNDSTTALRITVPNTDGASGPVKVDIRDLDFYYVNRSLYWVKEMNFDAVQRGLVQKRKVFNNIPRGIQGYAMNTRREPYNDIRVRKALTLLQNRQLLVHHNYNNNRHFHNKGRLHLYLIHLLQDHL